MDTSLSADGSPPAPGPSAATAPCAIMIVDDHPLVREGMKKLLARLPGVKVCAEAGTPAEALGQLAAVRPDLVVTDLSMPGRAGVEFVKDLHAADPAIRIVVLTMHDENEFAERTLRAGASAYLMKNLGAAALLAAITRVRQGEIVVSPRLSTQILHRLARRQTNQVPSAVGMLSDREIEVLALIGEGLDSAGIAAKLRLSRKTVDVHRANIKRKLGLANSTALVRFAMEWSKNRPPSDSA